MGHKEGGDGQSDEEVVAVVVAVDDQNKADEDGGHELVDSDIDVDEDFPSDFSSDPDNDDEEDSYANDDDEDSDFSDDQNREELASIEKLSWRLEPSEVSPPPASASEMVLRRTASDLLYRGYLRGQEVAVQVWNSELMSSDDSLFAYFCGEVEKVSVLRHPNLLLFMGAFLSDRSNVMVVYEYLPLQLSAVTRKDAVLPDLNLTFAHRVFFAQQIALGMNFLHHQQPPITYLNLRASSVFLTADLKVKLGSDLLAKFQLLNMLRGTGTATGAFLGEETPPFYLSPEVLGSICNPTTLPWHDRPVVEAQRSDIFSFGVLLWELITGEVPSMGGVSNYIDLNAQYAQHRHLAVPGACSTSLQQLMRLCWHPNPDQRPTFDDILAVTDKINPHTIYDVLVDGLVLDRTGREFWKTHWLESDKVHWGSFVTALTKTFGLDLAKDDTRFLCIKAIVANDNKVELGSFGRLLQFFGPMPHWIADKNSSARTDRRASTPTGAQPVATIMEFLDKISTLLRQPWFHGELTTIDAERKLKHQPRGTFLVRFSSRDPGSYTMSASDKNGTISHFRIFHKPTSGYRFCSQLVFPTLEALVGHIQAQLGLTLPCPGSPFDGVEFGLDRSTAAYYQPPNLTASSK